MTTILSFIGGLIILVAGAELLVRGASVLASRAGISSLVVGLTVVAFGTSAPELAVSVGASLGGQPDLAVGNVVGSNIFNVLFVLGASALIIPLSVSSQLVRFDVPVMVGASVIVWVLMLDGVLSRLDSVLLLAGMVVYTGVLIVLGRRAGSDFAGNGAKPPVSRRKGILRDVVFVLTGLAMLVLGSRFLVNASVQVARWLEISELLIGLTIVAGGTSLPEVATSIVAALRGQRDIAVGNVVGSNIFNLLIVLAGGGIASAASVGASMEVLLLDIPMMLFATILCFPVFFSGMRINRMEGGFFLLLYVGYMAVLITRGMGRLPDVMSAGLFLFSIIPVAAVYTIAVVFIEIRHRRAAPER